MNWMHLIFVAFTAVLGFLLINSRALLPDSMLAERFARNGILKGQGFPDADAPTRFVARLKARERTAALVSGLAVIPAIAPAMLLPEPTMGVPFMASVAFVARSATLAALGSREAFQLGTGPRVSRGRVVTLADNIPAWAIAVPVAAQVAFVLAMIVLVEGPSWQPWVLGASVLVSGASVLAAAWLARQPQRAEDPTTLAWSEAVRREDVFALLTLGPILTMIIGALLLGFTTHGPIGILVWANFAVVLACGIVAGAASRRRLLQRLPLQEPADARR